MTTYLTKQQMLDLLAGAGPSISPNQVERLETALRDDKQLTAEELGLNAVPAIREE
jgi:hypothetical protein